MYANIIVTIYLFSKYNKMCKQKEINNVDKGKQSTKIIINLLNVPFFDLFNPDLIKHYSKNKNNFTISSELSGILSVKHFQIRESGFI